MKTSLRKLIIGIVFFTSISHFSYSQTFQVSPNGKVSACDGDSVKIEATKGFAMYYWSTSATTSSIVAKKSGTYICGARDIKGNVYIDSVKIVFNQAQKPTISTNPKGAEVCKGDSLVIEASGKNLKYEWNGKSGSGRFVSYPTSSGSVYLITTDSNGCKAKTVINYTVKNCSGGCNDLITTYPDAILCGNKDSVKLLVKSGFSSYNWSDGVSGSYRYVKNAGWYVVTAKDASGNICKDSILIKTGLTEIKVYRYPNDHAICPGDKIKAYIDNKSYDSIKWDDNKTYLNLTYAYYAPTKTTSYYVYAKDKNGCVSKGQFTVTVKDTCGGCGKLITASKTSLCGDKDSVKLQAESGFAKYVWSTKQDGKYIYAKTKGWYYLTVIKTDNTICFDSIYIGSGGKAVEIKSNSTHSTICKGESITLEATSGFKTYGWSVSGDKKDNAIKFSPKESVKVYVEAVDEAGCVSKSYIYVTVKDCKHCPDILGAYPSSSLCGRDSVIIEAKNGYSGYTWNDGTTGRLLTVKKTGWYWIKFKDSSGYECRDSVYISKSSPKSLVIYAHNKKAICKGDTVEFSATKGFKNYWWNTGAKTQSFVFVAERNKEIVVEAMDSNGCEARAVYKLTLDSCGKSGIDQLGNIEVKVFPIPAGNMCWINTGESQISSISLYDVYGRMVKQVEDINHFEFGLDLSDLSDGNYVINITSTDGSARRVIIKSGEVSR